MGLDIPGFPRVGTKENIKLAADLVDFRSPQHAVDVRVHIQVQDFRFRGVLQPFQAFGLLNGKRVVIIGVVRSNEIVIPIIWVVICARVCPVYAQGGAVVRLHGWCALYCPAYGIGPWLGEVHAA